MSTKLLSRTNSTNQLIVPRQMNLLRFMTCGSVDDGKSTLIGRILYESQSLFTDQLSDLRLASKKTVHLKGNLDFSLLLDGLMAEREQGITIDVAHRYFTTPKRAFIVADAPGHEKYTRNMATAASTADVALVLVDASKGITTQTRRHSFIASMLGVKKLVLAINKMDLLHYDKHEFERIKTEYEAFLSLLGVDECQSIPISALTGVNVTHSSRQLSCWYKGPTLMNYLEEVLIEPYSTTDFFRMPVQWVNRAASDFRGLAGRISAGQIKPGDRIQILPGNQQARVSRIVSLDKDLKGAVAGQSVTLTLDDELDVSRGDLLVSQESLCQTSDSFATRILWLDQAPLVHSRQYVFKSNTVRALATLSKLKNRIDINTLVRMTADELALNEVGEFDLFLDRLIAFEPFSNNKELGSFILIDRRNFDTVAVGFICSPLKKSTDGSNQKWLVGARQRTALKGHKPVVIWFTGLSGAGKSTIANFLERALNALGKHSMLLDGDCIRQGINQDLDFTASGRYENIRRIAEVAKLMSDAGLITLVCCISPFVADREMARQRIGDTKFLEIHVDAPLSVVEARDVKGFYKEARMGKIAEFTGISSPYERPKAPDLHIDTVAISPKEASDLIIELLKKNAILEE